MDLNNANILLASLAGLLDDDAATIQHHQPHLRLCPGRALGAQLSPTIITPSMRQDQFKHPQESHLDRRASLGLLHAGE